MLRKLIELIDLRNEVEDIAVIQTEIEKGIEFKGTNLWILVFAIVVASVGLNTNSTAVIIGAMLISPLMGPINGMGYALATYDFDILKRSVKNFTFSVIASLVASTVYFSISPVSTAHSELLARTQPTIYDVLIAMFGGLAGIVAISSKIKGNVIAGVAIATALMPPLCTAGYGLATGQFSFFFGATYLFTINTVFIALAAVLFAKALKFPTRNNIDNKQKRLIQQVLSAIITLTFVPSIYFGYHLVQNEKFNQNAILYCKNVTFVNGAYLLEHEIDAPRRNIKLIYGGNFLLDGQRKDIFNKAKDFNLIDANITIEQGFSNDLSLGENEILKNQISLLNESLKINNQKLDSIVNKPLIGKDLLLEIKPMYPSIKTCAYSETIIYSDSSSTGNKSVLVVFTTDEKPLSNDDKTSLSKWLNARLKRKDILTVFQEAFDN